MNSTHNPAVYEWLPLIANVTIKSQQLHFVGNVFHVSPLWIHPLGDCLEDCSNSESLRTSSSISLGVLLEISASVANQIQLYPHSGFSSPFPGQDSHAAIAPTHLTSYISQSSSAKGYICIVLLLLCKLFQLYLHIISVKHFQSHIFTHLSNKTYLFMNMLQKA